MRAVAPPGAEGAPPPAPPSPGASISAPRAGPGLERRERTGDSEGEIQAVSLGLSHHYCPGHQWVPPHPAPSNVTITPTAKPLLRVGYLPIAILEHGVQVPASDSCPVRKPSSASGETVPASSPAPAPASSRGKRNRVINSSEYCNHTSTVLSREPGTEKSSAKSSSCVLGSPSGVTPSASRSSQGGEGAALPQRVVWRPSITTCRQSHRAEGRLSRGLGRALGGGLEHAWEPGWHCLGGHREVQTQGEDGT